MNSSAPPAELQAARNVLARMVEELPQDAAAAFKPEYLAAIRLIREEDPASWTRFKAHLQKARVAMVDINKALKKGQPVPDDDPDDRTRGAVAGEQLPGCPTPDLWIPWPYRLADDATEKEGTTQDGAHKSQVIAYAPVVIAGRLKDTDENTESLRVGWKRGAGWSYLTVEKARLMTSSKLVELATQGFPVAETTAKEMVGYMHTIDAANYTQIPSGRVASHLGWQGKDGALGFLWGRTFLMPDGVGRVELDLDDLLPEAWPDNAVAFRGIGGGDDQLAGGFHSGGTYEGWLAAVQALDPYPRAMLGFYAAFVPPLLSVIGAPNFAIDWPNRTSTGKTTTLRVAASVWGDPDERNPYSVIHSWDATKVWIERGLSVITGLPLILDDTMRAKKPEQVPEMIYLVANGQGRGRGNQRSLAQSRSWHSVLLSSGEMPATSFSQDGGSRMRCLIVRGSPYGTVSQKTRQLVHDLNRGVVANYGHAGPRFVQYLQRNRQRWESYKVAYTATATRLATLVNDPASARLANYGAAIEEAAKLAHDALGLPWAYADTVEKLWPTIVNEATDAAGEERALQAIVAIAYARQTQFYGRAALDPATNDQKVPPGGWLGRWDRKDDWEFIAFYPPVLDRLLRELQFQPEAILEAWRERGFLDCDGGRTQRTKRVAGELTKVVAIKRTAIEAVNR